MLESVIMKLGKNVDEKAKEDDTMAVAKPVNMAFTIRASKVKEFERASNKKDIEKIMQVASKFDQNIKKLNSEKQ